MAVAQATRVADANDEFRRSGFGVTLTLGVQSLAEISGLLHAVRAFDTFTKDNDPYGEHDFGSIIWDGQTVLWKISYYDQLLKYGEDPESPNCRRVLTVMLASEY